MHDGRGLGLVWDGSRTERLVEQSHEIEIGWAGIHRYAQRQTGVLWTSPYWIEDYEWNPEEALQWFWRWAELSVPREGCNCESHFRDLVTQLPPDTRSPFDFAFRAWEIHNAVNERISTNSSHPQILWDECCARWALPDAKNFQPKANTACLLSPFEQGGLERWSIGMARLIPEHINAICIHDVDRPTDLQLRKEIIERLPLVSKSRLNEFDNVIASCCEPPDTLPPEKLILVAHGICEYTRRWLQRAYRPGVRIVAPSHIVRNRVQGWHPDAHVSLIPHVVTPGRKPDFHDRFMSRFRWFIPAREIVLGYRGRFTDDKRISQLVKAFATLAAKYPNVWLVLQGWGDKRRLEKVAGEHHERLKFMPPDSDAFEFHSLIDGFVSFSKEEGFGLAMAEALRVGVPVLAYKTGVLYSDYQSSEFFRRGAYLLIDGKSERSEYVDSMEAECLCLFAERLASEDGEFDAWQYTPTSKTAREKWLEILKPVAVE